MPADLIAVCAVALALVIGAADLRAGWRVGRKGLAS